jgi:hypothetical protein
MTTEQFAQLTQQLARPSSRRSVMRGLVGGGALALLGVRTVATADTGTGKAKGKTKLSFCHKPDATTGEGKVITVAEPAAKGHLNHGDTLCPVDECKSYTKKGSCTVTEGAATCAFTPRTNAPCNAGAGTCDANGVCIPNQAPVEE